MLNAWVGLGRLGRDADFKSNSRPMTKFSFATETCWYRDGKQNKRVEWIPCVAWGPEAEASRYLRTGDVVFVRGRFTTSSWVDKTTQQKRYKSEVVVDQVVVLPYALGGPICSAVEGMLSMLGILVATMVTSMGQQGARDLDRTPAPASEAFGSNGNGDKGDTDADRGAFGGTAGGEFSGASSGAFGGGDGDGNADDIPF